MQKIIFNKKIQLLKKYFEKEPLILLAFVFGSYAKHLERKVSDWDIAVYFKPKQYLELETEEDYPNEDKFYHDLANILETDNIDFLVLNRARPSLVFSILNKGLPLAIKDRKLYSELLCRTSYEAIDFWNFSRDFWQIRERSKSLSPEDKSIIMERLVFLENELSDIEKFEKMQWLSYFQNRDDRRNIERWVENLVMASLDIAKIVLASEKKEIPQAYKDTLLRFGTEYLGEDFGKKFSKFAPFRNIVVHDYLDIRWKQLKNFIKDGKYLYPEFIKKVKEILK